MTAAPVLAEPRAARPRSRLGTRLALVLMPLVLIPVMLMGAAAYLRTQDLIRLQVVSRLSSAVVNNGRLLQAWIFAREDRLTLTSQSAAVRREVEAIAAAGGQNADLSSLEAALTTGESALFNEFMVVRASDLTVLAASDSSRQGSLATPLQDGTLSLEGLSTAPFYGDVLSGFGGFAWATSVPVPSESGETELYLIGVTYGDRVTSLLRQMQGFWSKPGAFQEELGHAYVLLSPDRILRLPDYIFATDPEVLIMPSHPVFSLAAESTAGDTEYPAFDGVPVVSTYEWVPDRGLGLVAEVPRAEVFSGLGSLAPFTVGLVVFAAMLCFVIVLIATDRLMRPLGQLAEFADRISRGEWGHRVPEKSDDEIGALATSFNRMADDLSGLYGSLEAQVEERTRQVRTAADVAHAVTSTPNLDDLLRRAVDLIRDRFGYYHVTIFLLDETAANAVVRESTGEIGQLMKARRHSLAVGSPSVIGWVTANNQGRIATDVGRDPIHLKNELLPETRSEAAVPLQVAGTVLGALDVQSKEINAFSPEALEVLQALADQLSTAIQNARLAQDSVVAAERARLLTAVTGQFGGLMDVESVLETAAHTLHRVLGQPEIVITLAPDVRPAAVGGDGRG
ncbi:MAG TPA: GAF domain-containing protein [Anaerolineales bacterium]|nr:GAF domain-containing protein [Anaerolineales bacterium]